MTERHYGAALVVLLFMCALCFWLSVEKAKDWTKVLCQKFT